MKTVKEAAKELNVSPSMIYGLVQAGKLAHFRIGNAIRISEGQIKAFLEERERAVKEETPPTRKVDKPKLKYLDL